MKTQHRDFNGEWRIAELLDMMDDYVELGQRKPHIRISVSADGNVSGEYECGLSSGTIDGGVREFGSETVIVFGFEGFDEMDQASGGGWAQLRDDGKLDGEFVNNLGRFVARRIATKKKGKRSTR
ncbi:MAG: hypothetical protein HZC38_02425 [Chloroflexi bacterium]|nr:hypothetical protein [Chloroflexota bacterium]